MFKKSILLLVCVSLSVFAFGLNKNATIVVMAPQDQI